MFATYTIPGKLSSTSFSQGGLTDDSTILLHYSDKQAWLNLHISICLHSETRIDAFRNQLLRIFKEEIIFI